jgi:hypothetical protein
MQRDPGHVCENALPSVFIVHFDVASWCV